jgi:hypothetical protein
LTGLSAADIAAAAHTQAMKTANPRGACAACIRRPRENIVSEFMRNAFAA